MAGQIEVGGAESALATAMALRFQYFPDDPTPAPGSDASATLWGFQWMFTVRARGTGIRIPLSISFANRTEERKEKNTRASIGVVYDFDAAFARLRP